MKRKISAVLQFCYLQKLFHHFQLVCSFETILSERKGFTVFQNILLSLTSFSFKLLQWSLFAFFSSETWLFRCDAYLFAFTSSLKNLLRSLVLFVISFEGALFISDIWFTLAYFCFQGAPWSNVDWHILKIRQNFYYQVLGMNLIFQAVNHR